MVERIENFSKAEKRSSCCWLFDFAAGRISYLISVDPNSVYALSVVQLSLDLLIHIEILRKHQS